MSKAEQFKTYLNSLELGDEVKTDILTKFGNVDKSYSEIIEDIKTSRDETKSKLNTYKEQLSTVKNVLKIDDDLSEDVIKQALKDSSNIDKIEEKYQGDLQKLRDELSNSNEIIKQNEAKFNDLTFKTTIIDNGFLNDFVDEPMARNNIIDMVKDKVIFQDGQMFAKDLTTGKIATDLTTGKPLGADSVISEIKSNINPMYLKPDVKANGGGASDVKSKNSGALKRSEMSASEKGKFIKENGQGAYLSLAN
jgi:hypothetical protein